MKKQNFSGSNFTILFFGTFLWPLILLLYLLAFTLDLIFGYDFSLEKLSEKILKT